MAYTDKQIQEQAEKLQFDEIIKMKSVILFMPHFNQNVKLRIETNFIANRDGKCFRMRGRVLKHIVCSEWIFTQKCLDEMTHIFKPKQ